MPIAPNTKDALLDRLVQDGFADRAAADRAVHAVLRALGERLTEDEAKLFARRLPAELARVIEDRDYDRDFDAAELYHRVRIYERASPGVAREHVDVVLRALGDAVEPDALRRLARALPDDVARQLEPRELGAPPPHVPPSHAPPLTTLARGRAGSRHPISEAAPSKGQAHSVAVNDDPHAETKLSSSHGMTQERWRESLATGRPPAPERPIDDANDR
jgi:uncharacterized protein (DUF2267 family)